MRKDRNPPARVDPFEFEQECEAWDWARAAGVSAQDLRGAVREALRSGDVVDSSFAKAA